VVVDGAPGPVDVGSVVVAVTGVDVLVVVDVVVVVEVVVVVGVVVVVVVGVVVVLVLVEAVRVPALSVTTSVTVTVGASVRDDELVSVAVVPVASAGVPWDVLTAPPQLVRAASARTGKGRTASTLERTPRRGTVKRLVTARRRARRGTRRPDPTRTARGGCRCCRSQ